MDQPLRIAYRSLACVLCVSIAGHSAAETSTSIAIDPTPPGDAAFLVGGADARGSGILRARLLFDYAEEPLVLIGASGRAEGIVERQSTIHATVSYSFLHRLLVYASLPIAASTETESPFAPGLGAVEPASGAAAGDARVGVRVRVLGAAAKSWQLAATVEGRAPTGKREAYVGDDTFGVRSLLALGTRSDSLACAFELGFRTRDTERFGGVLPTRVGSAIGLGGAAQLPIDRGRRVWLGPEISSWLTVGGGAELFDPRSTVVQILLGARYRPWSLPLEFAAGAGPGLGQGAGSPDYRALAGLAWVPEMPPPPPDRDSDSVPDASDVCLNLPGAPSNDPLMNGCPEVPLDTDGDGIPDAYDACPNQAGIPTAARRTHGCPRAVDADVDGIADSSDACPRVAGVASNDPTKNGCPTPTPAATLVEHHIVITEQVQFETGTASILPESAAILAAVARVMRENPGIVRVEVEGHTDDTGTPAFNLRLSHDRARAVLEWLVAHGVERTRLTAHGYGQTRPIADNVTDAGKTANRRVEFRVLPTREPGRAP